MNLLWQTKHRVYTLSREHTTTNTTETTNRSLIKKAAKQNTNSSHQFMATDYKLIKSKTSVFYSIVLPTQYAIHRAKCADANYKAPPPSPTTTTTNLE